ncbi:MAG: methylmalonyl-CoA epimerase [Chloroflexi bacterium]|nr:methylmalonyl-CoA epimerase [Chloroflexota bacterium]
MINKIDHVGIAVRSIDNALKLYTEVLGLKVESIEVSEEQKVKTAIMRLGESKIELLESTDPAGPVAKHIERKGEGLHHLAFEVDDIEAALRSLAEKGVPVVDAEPRAGVEASRIAFLHPRGARALLELVEHGKAVAQNKPLL